MSKYVQKLRNKLVTDTPTDWQVFHQLIAERLSPNMAILDIGCGKGTICPFPWQDYPTKYLVGIDPDPSASQNPYFNQFVLLRSSPDHFHWPVDDETFDLVIARYVLEHVFSETFFENVRRVLKPGGEFLFLTPNLLHPAVMVSSVLPHDWKLGLLKMTSAIDARDIFPTQYRFNTGRSLRSQAKKHGLLVKHFEVREQQPIRYLDFSASTFMLAYIYYRVVRWVGLGHLIGSNIIGIMGPSG
jgi:SAM-dependent methyltransferase